MGNEALEIYKTKKIANNSETLQDIQKLLFAKVLKISAGFERVNAKVNGLHRGSEPSNSRRIDINYTNELRTIIRYK